MRFLPLSLVLAIGCGGHQQRREPVEPEEYHGCGLRSTDRNPDPCDTSAGQINPYGTHDENNEAGDSLVEESVSMDERSSTSPRTGLRTAQPVLDGYNRKDWKHWIDEDLDCQDTRQEVLIEESEVSVIFETERRCKVLTGKWTCPFTGEVFTDPSRLDVSHMVPLEVAHAAGGHAWDAEQRRAFANELGVAHHLIAVKASSNRSREERGPEEWLPDVDAYRCEYVRSWIDIKRQWNLHASAHERESLEESLRACENGEVPGKVYSPCDKSDPLCGLGR